jgi:hypothetical protein
MARVWEGYLETSYSSTRIRRGSLDEVRAPSIGTAYPLPLIDLRDSAGRRALHVLRARIAAKGSSGAVRDAR